MTFKICLIFAFYFCLPSTEAWKVVASTSVTTAKIGEPFIVRCEVPFFNVEADTFELDFLSSVVQTLAYYYVSPASPNYAKKTLYHSSVDSTNEFIEIPKRLNHTENSAAYEILITPKVEFNSTFYCYAWYKNEKLATSNNVSLLVTSTLPTITSNVSQVLVNEPFTLTCTLDQDFKNLTANQAYSVRFFNARDGRLASYEVDVSGKVFLSSERFPNVTSNLGTRVSFPVFDLEVTEKVDPRQSYWCKLVTETNKKFESLHWKPEGPFVDFSSTVNGAEHQGRCTLSDFEHFSTTEYQVHFYSDLGDPKSSEGSLLGYFWLRPNKISQFVAEHNFAPWASVSHGASVSYPHFEIVAKLAGTGDKDVEKGRWWCAISIGQPGQANYRLIKSNRKELTSK